uniref:Armadillo repeat-containing domain-containing protein n=1 Tax=Timema monikensis TaxID=170555 RepID=A0A7R9HNG0_9NEOP|nr:unnamed protein product [Timema monikensis]
MEALQATYEKKGYPDEHRLYFRRLSQTTQTDVLLGNLDMTGSGKVILRPLSVQERIRELNLRARMFTDTMLAIQGISPRHSPLPGPRSLQCSPWSSPRILSPVDVRHILASRSTENLSGLASHGELVGSPIRRRWSRRSLRRSVPSKSRSPEGYREYEEIGRKEAEKLLRDGEEELRLHLESLSNRDRVITAHEAKSLVALLHSHDELLLERTLTTIANCGTFSANQATVAMVFPQVATLCRYVLGPVTALDISCSRPRPSRAVLTWQDSSDVSLEIQGRITFFLMASPNFWCLYFGGLGVKKALTSGPNIQDAIPLLLTFVNKEQPTEKLLLSALLTLSNIAVLSDWHDEFYPVLHALYQLVDTGAPQVKLQALKLLVNLSCNEDMVPSLLAAQAPRRLIYFLDPSTNEDILLRVVTLLANLTTTAKEQKLDPTIDLPAEDKAASPDTIKKSPRQDGYDQKSKVYQPVMYSRRGLTLCKLHILPKSISSPILWIICEDCQQYYPYQCLGWKGEPRDLSGLFFRCPPCQQSTSSTASTPPYRSHLIATYQCPFPSPYPLPDFHSRGYEDPTTFTQRCELQLRIAHVDARMGTYHPTATQGHHRLVVETLWDGYLPSNGNSRTLPPSGGNFMGNILRLRKSSNNV